MEKSNLLHVTLHWIFRPLAAVDNPTLLANSTSETVVRSPSFSYKTLRVLSSGSVYEFLSDSLRRGRLCTFVLYALESFGDGVLLEDGLLCHRFVT